MVSIIDIEATVKSNGDDFATLISLGGGERRSPPYTGTKALMLAVLEDGLRSYLSCGSRIHAEAERWINGRQPPSVFSFRVICETLGLEPSAVIRALRKLRANAHAPGAGRRRRPGVRGQAGVGRHRI